ncbi:uncharacterized protein LOC123306905 [Coccinella septempunctata]|uniref:uncharacterized protein LOC123306905 n=1 Tax=Coccinella septempunctata TaxID=41139 RepID=UPI001D07EEC1|nr:uncharacterized protein LOC123306905 [Coccinella septempunctata]
MLVMTIYFKLLLAFMPVLLVLGPTTAYTIDKYDKNFDDSSEVEVFGKCRESTLFPIDIMARTVNPVYLKPNPHPLNYIPPKPKNGGRPKIIPDSKTYLPRRVSFPYPRRIFPQTPTNSYFYSSEGPFFRIWRTQWYTFN